MQFGIRELAVLAALAGQSMADYAPYNVTCPSDTQLTRKADSLNPDETDWLKKRDAVTGPALQSWLENSNLTDFDVGNFLNNHTIRIATAFSGGGYRAMLCGAGQFAALDNRTDGSTEPGHMGGIIQASTYLAGLSGGNWLVGSLVVNNWTTVQELQASEDVWDLEHSILSPGGINIFKTASYWSDINDDIEGKQDVGFNTSITDIWGRGLSHQFFNFSDGAKDIRFHYIRDYEAFKSAEMPLPIHVADGRAPNTTILNLNSTVFEFTPFEMGSWDPTLYTFTDIQYLGTEVSGGRASGSQCVNGFDNVGFVIGTSSSLFNQFILQLNSSGVTGTVQRLAQSLLTKIGEDNDDIAIYDPNPFSDIDYVGSGINSADVLDLVDGGEDNQNVPLHPLIQPERDIDAIFAFDNSADTYSSSPLGPSWANGSSLVQTYQRQFASQGNNTIFPHIPDTETLVYGGWTLQPTFFGCNRSNLSSLFNDSLDEADRHYPPVVIFLPNTEMSYQSNTSTFKLSYEQDEVAGIIENGYNLVTQANGTLDENWRTCVACALVLRAQQRDGVEPTDQCKQCFTNYCWDGSYTSASDTTPKRRDGKNNTEVAKSGSASASSAKASAQATQSSSSKKNDAGVAAPPYGVAALLLGSLYALL